MTPTPCVMPPKAVKGKAGKASGGKNKSTKQQVQATPAVSRSLQAQNFRVQNKEVLQTITLPASKDGLTRQGTYVYPAALKWLNGIARSYQKYEWYHIQLYYASMCGDSTGGMVGLTYTVDMRDTIPATMADLYCTSRASVGSVHAGWNVPSTSLLPAPMPESVIGFDLGRKRLQAEGIARAINYATVDTVNSMSNDLRDTVIALAVETLCEGGDGSGTKVGYIIVSYDVELMNPIAPSSNI